MRISFLSSPFVFDDDDDEDEDEDMVVILARALLLFLANLWKTRASEPTTVDDAVVVAELIFIPRVFLFFLSFLVWIHKLTQSGYVDTFFIFLFRRVHL